MITRIRIIIPVVILNHCTKYCKTSINIHVRDIRWQFAQCWQNVGWLIVLRISVALVVFQPYRDLEAGDNQSLKLDWRYTMYIMYMAFCSIWVCLRIIRILLVLIYSKCTCTPCCTWWLYILIYCTHVYACIIHCYIMSRTNLIVNIMQKLSFFLYIILFAIVHHACYNIAKHGLKDWCKR